MRDERFSSLGCSRLSDNPIENLCASAGLCRSNAMRIPQSISRAKEETSQIQRLARISDVAPPTWSYIGQWQSSFQKGLPFEEVNALQIHHHADKLSARLLVHALRQVYCSHCIRHPLSVTVPERITITHH